MDLPGFTEDDLLIVLDYLSENANRARSHSFVQMSETRRTRWVIHHLSKFNGGVSVPKDGVPQGGGALGQDVPPSVVSSPSTQAEAAESVVMGGDGEQEARPSGPLTLAVPRVGAAPLVRSPVCGGAGAQEAVVSTSVAL